MGIKDPMEPILKRITGVLPKIPITIYPSVGMLLIMWLPWNLTVYRLPATL